MNDHPAIQDAENVTVQDGLSGPELVLAYGTSTRILAADLNARENPEGG
jgi:hypothetical protein